MSTSKFIKIVTGVGTILLIPLISMQFTDEVNWGVVDFVVAGFLLLITAVFIDLVSHKIKNRKTKIVVASAILLCFLLVYMELAVGIFGSPFSGS